MARDIPRRLDEGSVPGDIVEFERRGYTARGSLHSGARMGA
ncbi:MAG: hypothetical protein QF890_11095 [Myxococcota bacterium]|nr:hypothetical protein [Myxococcota bacterium]MDP7073258.1 hypothetical protein [Myxococcota bacterium]MDP7300468.1 hypothetical protein [Myxococcota bacterium]MDP7433105.1 hypothetical protein [Myxococcota bacterium]MDP7570620.1 hypothetical protein [Myxococcota bacterium]